MDDRIEAVARAYCRRMGLDPDEMIPDPFPDYILKGKTSLEAYEILRDTPKTSSPRWKQFRHKARVELEHVAMQEAIAEVMAAPPKTPDTPSDTPAPSDRPADPSASDRP